MKTMKRIACMLLALMMILPMACAYADDAPTGSITINGIGATTQYDIYRLLDLESYNLSSKVYSYKVNADWAEFFATQEAQAYFTVDTQGYATWTGPEDGDAVATFAKGALSYAKAQGIDPVKSSAVTGDMTHDGTTGKFSGLPLGYYLVDSTMGALCGLTTTNPNASINAKNGIPTVDKQVEEDSTQQYGGENSADIGQIVNYRTTISVHAGAENYVLHDKMSTGLTFKGVTRVEHVIPGKETHTTDTNKYVVYTKETNPDQFKDDCTFEVHFTKEFCDSLETNDKVIVYYSAMLNRNAVVAGTGNSNDTFLEYGEHNSSNHDSTTTKTYAFDIIKTDSQNTLIDGAKFKVYDAETGGNEVAVVLMDDGVTYRRARTDETGIEIVVANGKVRVVGFDNGTYYLEETATPQGYNQLGSRQKFIISDSNLDSVFNDGIYSTGSGVHVVNKSGTMLPETGGVGTTLFYVIGGALAVAAVVLLVTKKRMNGME